MMQIFKRYSMALLFLLLVIILMLAGTLGVKSFGDHLFKDANITIKPEGERIAL
ncbi:MULTISPECIES: hypothetical protein [Sulfurimonas]|uniref:hypothetical protein n=1 Tax=Sulfurimonas TaxID=202746 RepID=UPI00165F0676|nr:hypothetical protein [Sulfurimonas indica]